jgi:hypothetical protein
MFDGFHNLHMDGEDMEIEARTVKLSKIRDEDQSAPRGDKEYVGVFSSLEELVILAWERLNTEKIDRIYFCYQYYRRFWLFRMPRHCATVWVRLENGIPRLTKQIEPA